MGAMGGGAGAAAGDGHGVVVCLVVRIFFSKTCLPCYALVKSSYDWTNCFRLSCLCSFYLPFARSMMSLVWLCAHGVCR